MSMVICCSFLIMLSAILALNFSIRLRVLLSIQRVWIYWEQKLSGVSGGECLDICILLIHSIKQFILRNMLSEVYLPSIQQIKITIEAFQEGISQQKQPIYDWNLEGQQYKFDLLRQKITCCLHQNISVVNSSTLFTSENTSLLTHVSPNTQLFSAIIQFYLTLFTAKIIIKINKYCSNLQILIISSHCCSLTQTMAIAKSTKTASRSKAKSRLLTKKQKAYKRVSYIRKVIQRKRKTKIALKKTKVSHKRKQHQQAEQENIELVAPQQNFHQPSNQQEINILNILGLTDDNMGEEAWEKKLENKLKEVNSKSIDNPEVRRVYGEIGKIFSTYRSGKVPKAFKVIPNLDKWRQVLTLTQPQKWTPQAMYQAVTIFASNFDPIRAEEFYRDYLVPAVRRDLLKNKKLNYHYYESLIKSLYKTNAWFKGVLFQFCGKQTAPREISVVESLLAKMSIPVISSSVAIIKMTEMQPTPATLHYLKALIGKNYSLPKKVLTVLTNYLLQFQQLQEEMPVLWHQFFLTILKQYGSNLDEMAKASLVQLAKKKCHKLITPQILKELH